MSHLSRIGFVVFGLGRAGTIHSMNLIRNPQTTLKWIVDVDEDKAKKFVTENFADAQVTAPSSMDRALLDPTVQAAVIATPTDMHEDIVMRCLQAGKAVFCEKPVAPTFEAIGKNLCRFPSPLDRLGFFFTSCLTPNSFPRQDCFLVLNIRYFIFTCVEIFPSLFRLQDQ